MSSVNWKESEKIVKMIEECLLPSARVEHDVKLPDLNSRVGSTRQFDVVIRTGRAPRETITVVEVQDRSKKVDITMFDGWVSKMRDVGAQHLMCVSYKGYPNSVIDKAQRLGPTIRLMTLNELELGQWPIGFLKSSITTNRREILAISNSTLDFKYKENTDKLNMELNPESMLFRIANRTYNMIELIYWYLDGIGMHIRPSLDGVKHLSMELPINNEKLFYVYEGTEVEVLRLYQELEVRYEVIETPMECVEYEQVDYNSKIGWLIRANVNINREDIVIKFILIARDDGSYEMVYQSE